MPKQNELCPTCGTPVKIVGKTTMSYEPIKPREIDNNKIRRIIRSNMRLVHYKKFDKPAVKMRGYDASAKAITQAIEENKL